MHTQNPDDMATGHKVKPERLAAQVRQRLMITARVGKVAS